MSDGGIPVNDLPIDSIPFDESLVYKGVLARAALSQKLSKKDVAYCAISVEVTEPEEYAGMTVPLNYLPIPVRIDESASKAERYKASNQMQMFGRFVKSFQITGNSPEVANIGDGDARAAWQEWIEKFYGNEGKFTVRNQEFPEGSGRQRPGINDFVL